MNPIDPTTKAIQNAMWLQNARDQKKDHEKKIEDEFEKCMKLVGDKKNDIEGMKIEIQNFEDIINANIKAATEIDFFGEQKVEVTELSQRSVKLQVSGQKLTCELDKNQNELAVINLKKRELIESLNQLLEQFKQAKNKYYPFQETGSKMGNNLNNWISEKRQNYASNTGFKQPDSNRPK